MNILITGADGFLGREFQKYYGQKKEFNIIAVNRAKLNLLDQLAVDEFFKDNKVDIVLHTAVVGGKRGLFEEVDHVFENMRMFDNLIRHKVNFKLMINFGSGAEFDRKRPIDKATEQTIFQRHPSDYYGLAKNLITRRIYHLDLNVVNLRLFGCFGTYEEPQRLIKAAYNNILLEENIKIWRDKYMDYFFVEDVCRVIDSYIERSEDYRLLPVDLNLCYTRKYKLSEIVYLLKKLTNSKSSVIIEHDKLIHPYTGSDYKLSNLAVPLIGLEDGIEKCLKNWKEF